MDCKSGVRKSCFLTPDFFNEGFVNDKSGRGGSCKRECVYYMIEFCFNHFKEKNSKHEH